MSVKKDSGSAFFWVVIVLIIFWRAVRAARGEFSQKEILGGFKPTYYTQTFVKVAKQENNMSPKEVWKNLYHQIRWGQSKQEKKEFLQKWIEWKINNKKLMDERDRKVLKGK